jgi:trimeric autotransporter adhesin
VSLRCHLSYISSVCLLLSVALMGQVVRVPPAARGSIHGLVKSGNMPLPGATITATNNATSRKVVTWSDVDGNFILQTPEDGTYSVRAQMAAFAVATQDVAIGAGNRDIEVNLELILLSRQPNVSPEGPKQTPPTRAAGNRGFQSLRVTQGEGGEESPAGGADQIAPAGMPVPGIAPDSATESVAVSGNTSNPMGQLNGDDFRQRIDELNGPGGPGAAGAGFGGAPGGFGGGGFGGRGGAGFGGGGGRGRGFNSNQPHGSIFYSIGDSAFNAAPYSLTGLPVVKPGFEQNRFGASVGGPLNIPKIYHGGDKTFFFVNYTGSRGENPFDGFSTVPTVAERGGDFSDATVSSRGHGAATPVQIFEPGTNTPFPNETIPTINPVALALLQYIPLPNIPGRTEQNFYFADSTVSDSDDLNIRLNRTLGATTPRARRGGRGQARNSVSIGFHYHGTNTNLTNPFPSVGGKTTSRSFDVPLSYTRTFGKLVNTARVDFNRSRTSTQNLYAFSQDVAAAAGITGVSQTPFDWGLPNLSFSNFGSLQDTIPLLQRNQTLSFSDSVIWNHKKLTWRWGGDFRRIALNNRTDGNPRGSFVFTGLNTSEVMAGQPVAGTGFDFADFLLGMPQQTSVQFGALQEGQDNYHFRGNSWDLFAQDEWKIRGNLTLNLGVRYEYISPYTEINDRLANLDITPGVLLAPPGVANVAPVLPGETGPLTGQQYPATLMHPDRNNFAPRIGIAWKPLRKTVVRAGYGINYNTGAYQKIIQQLAFQPPFAITATNIESSTTPLTLQNGFPAPGEGSITNSYGVDPNYRLGYVQIRNLDIQQEIRPTLILNLDYTGTKGTRLDILEAPNRIPQGIRIPNVDAFNWEDSQGDSEANAASVRIRKRLQHGVSIGGTYTFSKSIDDASTIGGGSTVVAQNAFDIAAERGLSSFNQTHKFSADYVWELPFGHDRRWLTNNTPARALLGDWQWSGDWTIASGLPFTPRILNDISDVNRGTNGTLRPNLVAGQSISLADPSRNEWFNTAAFVEPPVGPNGQSYGDARRNSIIGPGSLVFDMAMTKVVPLRNNRSFEVRATAANVFNRPQFTSIDTNLNSPTAGQVIGVGAMRTIQIIARFRF